MLKITNLQVAYDQHQVLKKLSASFTSGTVHGILGLNGSGKTTFFNSLYGFIPIQGGTLSLNDKDLTPEDMAYLETHNYFYPWLRGREYLELLTQNKKTFDVDQWNSLFDLPLDGLVENYSTGMKKKLAFLGILSFDRPILILDEPFNGVDVESTEKMDLIIQKLKKQNKIILLSSHILKSLTHLCDDIFVLNNGVIETIVPPKDFPNLESTFKEKISGKIQDTLDQLL
ncbi:MAG: ATP-binding cassette domain-containing protein [Saprospiraceae bacterium]